MTEPMSPDPGLIPLPNEKDLRRRYGITLDQYRALLDAQGGVCAICGKPPKDGKALVPDHNHDSLAIDGLVHWSPCNRRLTQQVRRYLADPPGRRFGWSVPAELEAKTIRRREANKTRARARRAEGVGTSTPRQGKQNTRGVAAQQTKQNAEGGSSYLDRLRAMTFHERTERALAETGGRR